MDSTSAGTSFAQTFARLQEEQAASDPLVTLQGLRALWARGIAAGLRGQEERRSAIELLRWWYRLSRDYGARADAEAVLLQAARTGLVHAELATPLAELLLQRPAELMRYETVTVRLLRSGSLSESAAARLRQVITRNQLVAPAENRDAAARRLRRTLRIHVGAPRTAATIAGALFALDRAEASLPFLRRAHQAGEWPDEWAPLLAYSYFDDANYAAAAGLASRMQAYAQESWMDGARLRIGLALIQCGEYRRAALLLRGLQSRYGWVATNPLALIGSLLPEKEIEPPGFVLDNLPELWLQVYWRLAAAILTARDVKKTQLLPPKDREVIQENERAREWTESLIRFAFAALIRRGEWWAAHAVLAAGKSIQVTLLPPWQEVILSALADQPRQLSGGLAQWLPEPVDPDGPSPGQTALMAALSFPGDAEPLVYSLWRAHKGARQQPPAVEALIAVLMRRAAPDDLRAWIAGTDDPDWRELLRTAARSLGVEAEGVGQRLLRGVRAIVQLALEGKSAGTARVSADDAAGASEPEVPFSRLALAVLEDDPLKWQYESGGSPFAFSAGELATWTRLIGVCAQPAQELATETVG